MSSQQPSLDFTAHQVLVMAADPSERKHKGNSESVAAHSRVIHSKAETYRVILDFIARQGRATGFDVARHMNKPLHAISGRLSELKQMNKLRKVGVENGAGVLELV